MKHIKEFKLNEGYADKKMEFYQKLMDICGEFREKYKLTDDDIQEFLDGFQFSSKKRKSDRNTLLLIFRLKDGFGNKHTLAVNQLSDDSIRYSYYGGWQDSGIPLSTSDMGMKKSLPTSVKKFSNIKHLQSEIHSCITSGYDTIVNVEEINKIRK